MEQVFIREAFPRGSCWRVLLWKNHNHALVVFFFSPKTASSKWEEPLQAVATNILHYCNKCKTEDSVFMQSAKTNQGWKEEKNKNLFFSFSKQCVTTVWSVWFGSLPLWCLAAAETTHKTHEKRDKDTQILKREERVKGMFVIFFVLRHSVTEAWKCLNGIGRITALTLGFVGWD